MKHISRYLVALTMAAALLCCGSAALAAEEAAPNIQVQLDGQPLAFTDAVPQVKDQRTFLPFRAVFEAMGAEVSTEGSVITAVRGGKTLAMTLNETTATLTEGDKTTPITMDVAPYVDNATWRTYVPVRFAAQAFDCAVGWDQQAMTAVIVDTDKLVNEALEGKEFTYLEKLMEYSKKYNQGIRDMEMTMDGTMSMLGADVSMAVTANGTVADETKMEMDMNMTMDMSQLMALSQQMGGAQITGEDKAIMDMMAQDGMGIAMRGDLDAGVLYMNMSGELFEQALTAELTEEEKAQLPVDLKDLWFSMDMNAMMDQLSLGMDWSEYLNTLKDIDYVSLVKTALSSADVNSAETGYTDLKTMLETMVDTLSDAAFVKEGDTYTTTLDLSEDANTAKVAFILTMKQDKVVGYAIQLSAAFVDADTDSAVTAEMLIGMDEKDQMTGKLAMDMAPLMAIDFNIAGSYKQGATAPQTQPPQGATVIDLNDLAAQPLLDR